MGKLIEIKDRLPPKRVEFRRATPEEEVERVFRILAKSGQINHYRSKSRWRRVVAIFIFWSFAFAYWMRGIMTGDWWF